MLYTLPLSVYDRGAVDALSQPPLAVPKRKGLDHLRHRAGGLCHSLLYLENHDWHLLCVGARVHGSPRLHFLTSRESRHITNPMTTPAHGCLQRRESRYVTNPMTTPAHGCLQRRESRYVTNSMTTPAHGCLLVTQHRPPITNHQSLPKTSLALNSQFATEN